MRHICVRLCGQDSGHVSSLIAGKLETQRHFHITLVWLKEGTPGRQVGGPRPERQHLHLLYGMTLDLSEPVPSPARWTQ